MVTDFAGDTFVYLYLSVFDDREGTSAFVLAENGGSPDFCGQRFAGQIRARSAYV